MKNEDLLTLLVAFVLGYFAHQMMRNMCGRRLVEGTEDTPNPNCEGCFYQCKNTNEFEDCYRMACHGKWDCPSDPSLID